MKKYIFLSLTLVICVICACRNNHNKAIDYVNKFVEEQNNIKKAFLKMDSAFINYLPSDMDFAFQNLNKQIKISTDKIQKIQPFNESNIMKNATKKLFEVYENISKKEIKQIIELAKKEEYNKKDEFKMQELFDNRYKKEKDAENQLLKVKKDFLKKN